MKKGNLSSVTLAVSLVFGSNTIAANPCIEKSTEFKESKNYSVDYANTVRSKRADQLVRIKIDKIRIIAVNQVLLNPKRRPVLHFPAAI